MLAPNVERLMTTEAINTDPLLQVVQPDCLLQSLVSMVNNSDLEIGITLLISGMLVSGSLVSLPKYFEGFAADFSSPFANDPEFVKSMKASFANLREEKSEEAPPPQYIHLKNARFFNTAGSPIPANKGVWWRGRIGEVGGFILGSLSAEGG